VITDQLGVCDGRRRLQSGREIVERDLQLEQVKASDSDWTWRRSGGRNPGVAWGRRRLGRVRDQRLAEACGVPGPAGFFATVVVSVVCDRRMAASLITTAMSARRIVTTHS
jgi:hypothetical protein